MTPADLAAGEPLRLKALCEHLEALAAWLDSNKPQSFVLPNFWSCRSADLRTAVAAIRELEERNELLFRTIAQKDAVNERARADAIEEAAQLCERRAMQKYDIAAIRALASAPAAEGEGKES